MVSGLAGQCSLLVKSWQVRQSRKEQSGKGATPPGHTMKPQRTDRTRQFIRRMGTGK